MSETLPALLAALVPPTSDVKRCPFARTLDGLEPAVLERVEMIAADIRAARAAGRRGGASCVWLHRTLASFGVESSLTGLQSHVGRVCACVRAD